MARLRLVATGGADVGCRSCKASLALREDRTSSVVHQRAFLLGSSCYGWQIRDSF
jgi:hypothetical protein